MKRWIDCYKSLSQEDREKTMQYWDNYYHAVIQSEKDTHLISFARNMISAIEKVETELNK